MTRDLDSGAGGHVDMTSNACLPRCEASSAGVTAGISIALANSRGSLGADFKHQCFLCMSLKYNVFCFVYLFVVVVFFSVCRKPEVEFRVRFRHAAAQVK